jgi:flagellar protein FlaG
MEMEAIRAKVEQAIEQLNEQVAMRQRELGFSIEGETDRLIVNVFNKSTGELVRQIPTEAVVRAADSFEALKGVLVDEIL